MAYGTDDDLRGRRDSVMSEWVSMDCSTPEDGYTALVIDRDGDMFVAYWSEEYGEFCLNYDYFNADSVTHWMALPQPPKRPTRTERG